MTRSVNVVWTQFQQKFNKVTLKNSTFEYLVDRSIISGEVWAYDMAEFQISPQFSFFFSW